MSRCPILNPALRHSPVRTGVPYGARILSITTGRCGTVVGYDVGETGGNLIGVNTAGDTKHAHVFTS
jgi:hypothetical protein